MNVLVGVDGGPDAVDALEWALERAAAAGDEVTVVVLESGGESDATERAVRETLAEADRSAAVRHVSAEGAGGALVEVAESEGFDEIVLGGGERSPMGKIRLDEVREFVLLNADVTVTLVR